jgi:Ca2+-binding RTX toxin-like protein
MDSFQYQVSDSLGLVSNVATVQISPVGATGAGPIVPQPDLANTVTLQPVSINPLVNDIVNDGSAADPSTLQIIAGPEHGSVAVNPTTGVVTYTPDFGFVGFEDLQYSVKTTAGHGPGVSDIFIAVYPEAPRLQADPFGGTMLVVDGTAYGDVIRFDPGHKSGDVMVTMNGVTSGPFHPTSRIVAFGYGGNDQITVSRAIKLPAWLDGGDGNDVLMGGGGPTILLGGAGNDLLVGGTNRNLLIGGAGQDFLVGNRAGDILITGSTSFDSNQTALAAIMSEWTSADSYQQRVLDLLDVPSPAFGSRHNGNFFLVSATVQSDGISNLVVFVPGQNIIFSNGSGPNADVLVTDLGRVGHWHTFW